MTDVLAYDIHGRKLRAGDEVELVSKYHQRTTVRGPAPGYTNCEVALDIPTGNDYPWLVGNGSWLRKLTDDDRPAWPAFTEWFHKRMSGERVPDEETAIAGMLWPEDQV